MVYGISSWTIGCGSHELPVAGTFAKVFPMLDFIEDVLVLQFHKHTLENLV